MKRILGFSTLLILFAAVTTVGADDFWAGEQLDRAYALLDQDNANGALTVLESAVAAAGDRKISDEELGMLTFELGLMYLALDRPDQAEPVLDRCLALRERIYGKDHLMVVETLDGLGSVYLAQNRLEDAEKVYRRLADAWTNLGGAQDPMAADAREMVENIQIEQRKPLTPHPFPPDGPFDPPPEIDTLGGDDMHGLSDDKPFIIDDDDGPIDAPPLGETENVIQTRSQVDDKIAKLTAQACVDPFEYNSEIGSKAVAAVFKGSGGVYERSTKYVLIQLYRNKSLGIKPVHINNVMKHFGVLVRAADATAALIDGDFSSVMDNVVKGGTMVGLGLKGVPMVGEIITALEIVQMSYRELKEQEDLLKVDLAYYKFMDDETLVRLMKTDRDKAVEHYVANYILKDKKHRERAQAYIDVELGERVDLNIDPSPYNPFAQINTLGLFRANPKLKSFLHTMLGDFEQRRSKFRQANKQAMALRDDPLFQFLRTSIKSAEEFAVAHEFFLKWCREYAQIAEEKPTPTPTATPEPTKTGEEWPGQWGVKWSVLSIDPMETTLSLPRTSAWPVNYSMTIQYRTETSNPDVSAHDVFDIEIPASGRAENPGCGANLNAQILDEGSSYGDDWNITKVKISGPVSCRGTFKILIYLVENHMRVPNSERRHLMHTQTFTVVE